MKKKINLIIIFYVLYFAWLFLLAYLWPNPSILTYFLLGIVVFYFVFLREKGDTLMFFLVAISSFFLGRVLAYDSAFAYIGFPPLGIPFWPIAWGVTAIALRKFYLVASQGPEYA